MLRTTSLVLLVALSTTLAVRPATAQVKAFVGATVFDGSGTEPITDAAILVEGERIAAIGPRAKVAVPEAAEVIDATGRWIVPGLVDAHIHYFQSGGLYTRPDIIDLREVRSYEREMAGIRAGLESTFQRYLASGVTAVVDVGGGYWNFEVRDEANRRLLAPRTGVAGPLVSTVSREQLDIGDPPIIQAESPEAARQLVRSQLEHRPDLIKIWFIVPADGNVSATIDIVEAVIDEAHAAGVRVAVHATRLEAARAAIQAGADVLVHSIDDLEVDPEFVQLAKDQGVIYTPTLVVIEGYSEVLGGRPTLMSIERALGDPEAIRTWSELPTGSDTEGTRQRRVEWLARTMPVMQANLRTLHEAGVPIAAGTDAGNIGTLHGPSIHRELELMAEAGLTPREILIAATRDAARVFAAEPEFGVLAVGNYADMLILESDPLADIANLQHLQRVVKGGEVLMPIDLVPPSPETVVQGQLEAYNARDIERFLSFFAEDVTVSRLPSGEVSYENREAMRVRYSKLFDRNPALHCRITKRIVHGDWVIDHELVTGIESRPRLRAVAIYEVRDGLIRTARFLPTHD